MSSKVGCILFVVLLVNRLEHIATYQLHNEQLALNHGSPHSRVKRYAHYGPAGDVGEQGETGYRGYDGPTGDRGPTGSQGSRGTPGYRGDYGDQGYRGYPGSTGNQGQSYLTGDPGRDGMDGAAGIKGEKGECGSKGARGVPGSPGVNGANGSDGQTGKPGEKGADGDIGAIGVSGDQDARPANGDDGDAGRNGLVGRDALNGIPGNPGNIIWQQPNSSSTDRSAAIPKTCYELKNYHLKSGAYKVDPNGGDPNDAIDVHCNFGREISTCIESPISDYVDVIDKVQEMLWLSKITLVEPYGIAKNQLQQLQKLSKKATQRVSYSWPAAEPDDMDATLIGWNDVEIRSDASFRFHFTTDVNYYESNNHKEKTMTFETNRPKQLPLIDVGITSSRALGEEFEFKIKIQEVCFVHQ